MSQPNDTPNAAFMESNDDDNVSVASSASADSSALGIDSVGKKKQLPSSAVVGHVSHQPDLPTFRGMAIKPKTETQLRTLEGGMISNLGGGAHASGLQLQSTVSTTAAKTAATGTTSTASAPSKFSRHLNKATPAKSLAPPVALVEIDTPRSGWSDPQLQPTPRYHPVHLCKNRLSLDEHSLPAILERVTQSLHAMSIQAKFNNDPVSATLLTMEDAELHLALWKCRASNDVLLEIHRTKGDAMVCAGYVRRIVEAAVSDDLDESHFRIDDVFDRAAIESTERAVNNVLAKLEAKANNNDDDSSDFSSDDDKDESGESAPSDTEEAAEEANQPTTSSLDIVHQFLSSDKPHKKKVALESLVVMSDPRKTVMSVAIDTALAVLTGSTSGSTSSSSSATTDQAYVAPTEEACRSIQDTVTSLVLQREYPDFDVALPAGSSATATSDKHRYVDQFPSDDEEDEAQTAATTTTAQTSAQRPAEYTRFLRHSFHMALTCFVNSVEVIANLEGHNKLEGRTLRDIIDSSSFTQQVVQVMSDGIRSAPKIHHRAYQGCKCLRYLCEASPKIRSMVQSDTELQARIQTAFRTGCERHWLLKSASQRLWTTVHADDDGDDEQQN